MPLPTQANTKIYDSAPGAAIFAVSLNAAEPAAPLYSGGSDALPGSAGAAALPGSGGPAALPDSAGVAAAPADAAGQPRTQRLVWVDALRGVVVLSMIGYHAMWDAVHLYGFSAPWFGSIAAYIWQQSICWVFLLLSGFCWPLSRRPLRRALIVFGAGVLVTLVTMAAAPGSRILFGVLTLIGSCSLLMVPAHRLLRRVPAGAGLAVSALLFAVLRNVNVGWLGFEGLRLVQLPAALYRDYFTAFLGFPFQNFASADYFPLLPWGLLFLCGYYANGVWAWAQKRVSALYRARAQRLDAAVRRVRAAMVLPAVGRHALLVYLLHQPVLTLCFAAVRYLAAL